MKTTLNTAMVILCALLLMPGVTGTRDVNATEATRFAGPAHMLVRGAVLFISWGGALRLRPGNKSIEAYDITRKKLLWSKQEIAVGYPELHMINGQLHAVVLTERGKVIQMLDPKTGSIQGEIQGQEFACVGGRWWVSRRGDVFVGGRTKPEGALPRVPDQCVISGDRVFLLSPDGSSVKHKELLVVERTKMRVVKRHSLPDYFTSASKGRIGNYWNIHSVRGNIALFTAHDANRLYIQAYDLKQKAERWSYSVAGRDHTLKWERHGRLIVGAGALGNDGWGNYVIDVDTGAPEFDYGKGSDEKRKAFLQKQTVLYGTLIEQLADHRGPFRRSAQNDSWKILLTNDGHLISIDLARWERAWKKSLAKDFPRSMQHVTIMKLVDDIVIIAASPGDEIFFIDARKGTLLTGRSSTPRALMALVTEDILCPKAEHHQKIIFNGHPVEIPNILEEKELLEQLDSPDEKEAYTVAIVLALGGNLRAFSLLLKKRDPDLLVLYGSNYQNRDGSKCVDPLIENKIIETFSDLELRQGLLTFFRKNLYRSRKLFDVLIAAKIDREKTPYFGGLVQSLVATRLPGIEHEVLEHAKRHIVNIDPKYSWGLSPVDNYYFDFFVERNYTPAVFCIRNLLDKTHYSTVPEVYAVHVYNRHRNLYHQLDWFPSFLVEGVFADQLAKLRGISRDEIFFNFELEAVGGYSLKHALSSEGRNRIVQIIAGLLEEMPVYDPMSSQAAIADIDFQMRSHAVELLKRAGTRSSGTILTRELHRQVSPPGTKYAAALIDPVLDGLSALPATAEIDVPDFITAIKKMEQQSRMLVVSEILKKHPHPDGHAFLIAQLQDVVVSEDICRIKYGMDSESAFQAIFDVLMVFDAADYLFLTRQQVDSLLESGSLDEELYRISSERLNALIGNESASYTVFRRKREAGENESTMGDRRTRDMRTL